VFALSRSSKPEKEKQRKEKSSHFANCGSGRKLAANAEKNEIEGKGAVFLIV
jgi:hypothetical protein